MSDRRSERMGVLFERHFDELFAYASLRVAPDIDAARDIVQEVFHSALDRAATPREERSERAWLFQVARHKIADHYRARGRDRPIELVESDLGSAGVVEPRESNDRSARVVSIVMRQLSEEDVALLEEKYFVGLSVKEIARRRSVTEKSVESALTRARQRFRTRVAQQSETRGVES